MMGRMKAPVSLWGKLPSPSKSFPFSLFFRYINQFLRLKQQADGYPRWVKTEEDKDKYIADYLAREKIQLQKDEIKRNEGIRQLSKLMLNSFWGKVGASL